MPMPMSLTIQVSPTSCCQIKHLYAFWTSASVGRTEQFAKLIMVIVIVIVVLDLRRLVKLGAISQQSYIAHVSINVKPSDPMTRMTAQSTK